jgi:hypothetical protein
MRPAKLCASLSRCVTKIKRMGRNHRMSDEILYVSGASGLKFAIKNKKPIFAEQE